MPIRTFLALDLDEHILDMLCHAQKQLGNPDDRVNWVWRENLHVTLKFLGDVADADLADVCRRMSDAARSVAPFEFDVMGLTCTPPHGPIRMVWAMAGDTTGLMNVLHEELDATLAELGIREEHRGFKPHITMARVKSVKQPGLLRSAVKGYADFDFGVQHCIEVVAYTSVLTDEGPIYTAVARAPLEG